MRSGPLRRILVAITAAGASSRMGRAKALLDWEGRTFLSAMAASVAEAGLPPPVVVVGADREKVRGEAERIGLSVLTNDRHAEGRGTSVRLAAERARDEGACLMLWPVDCPAVRPATLRRLAAAMAAGPHANVVPVCEGRRGHPVVLCRGTLTRLAQAPGSVNLREMLRGGSDPLVEVPVTDDSVLDNVNTPGDHEAFLEARGPGGPRGEIHA